MSFIDDIQGQNTQLYPIVTIEPPEDMGNLAESHDRIITLSTNNVSLGHIHKVMGNTALNLDSVHFKPLLLNIPSIKESIDIESRKFKISNVSLNISNVKYEGKRFTDMLSDTSLINWKCSIQFVSPSTTAYSTIFGVTNFTPVESFYDRYHDDEDATMMTQMVFQGIIRRISHDDEKVKIELEDLTEQKAHKDLPLADDYIQTESVPDKYKNKPTPIVYGHVDRSPVALDVNSDADIVLVADSNDIFGFNEVSPLYIHKSDTFLNAPIDAISPKTGGAMFRWVKNKDYDEDEEGSEEYITRYDTGIQYSLDSNIITLNGNLNDTGNEDGNSTGNAIGDNKIVVSQIVTPSTVSAIRKRIDDHYAYYSVKHDYDSVGANFAISSEVEHSNLPLVIRGIVFRESLNYNDWTQQSDSYDITGEAMWETTNEQDEDGDVWENGKCGCIIKLPIVEGLGKQDDDTKLSGSLGYVFADISAGFWERELWNESPDVDINFRIGGHKYRDHDGTTGMKPYAGQASAANELANPTNTGIAGVFNNNFDYSATAGAMNGLNNQGETYNSISGDDQTVIVHKSSSLLMYTRFIPSSSPTSFNSGLCFMQMQIKDLYVNQLDLVDNLLSQSFYANVKGRISPEFAIIGQDFLLQNPIDIIKDIVV